MNSHNRTHKRFTPGQFLGALAALFLGIVTVAYAVTLPFPLFTGGTAISSSQVNANFAALNAGLPQMWASTDNTFGGTTLTASGQVTVNSVTITVPAGGGFIVISGTAFVNNDAGTQLDYVLRPRIDGVDIISDFAAYRDLAANGPGDQGSLSYTLTVPIAAGTRTVSQLLGPSTGTANFFYNRQNLTVLFIPLSQGNVTPTITPLNAVPAAFEAIHDGGSATGN